MTKLMSLGLLFWLTALTAACGSAPPQTTGVGYLEGRASIGPLTPGPTRAGQPTPTPSPAACMARGLVITDASTGAEVASFSFGADCAYRVALRPGTYEVRLRPSGIDHSSDLPKTVMITSGQTVQLDVAIDTGIR